MNTMTRAAANTTDTATNHRPVAMNSTTRTTRGTMAMLCKSVKPHRPLRPGTVRFPNTPCWGSRTAALTADPPPLSRSSGPDQCRPSSPAHQQRSGPHGPSARPWPARPDDAPCAVPAWSSKHPWWRPRQRPEHPCSRCGSARSARTSHATPPAGPTQGHVPELALRPSPRDRHPAHRNRRPTPQAEPAPHHSPRRRPGSPRKRRERHPTARHPKPGRGPRRPQGTRHQPEQRPRTPRRRWRPNQPARPASRPRPPSRQRPGQLRRTARASRHRPMPHPPELLPCRRCRQLHRPRTRRHRHRSPTHHPGLRPHPPRRPPHCWETPRLSHRHPPADPPPSRPWRRPSRWLHRPRHRPGPRRSGKRPRRTCPSSSEAARPGPPRWPTGRQPPGRPPPRLDPLRCPQGHR
uniref:Putative hydroxyproline-rich protein n=1 Tax=Micrococcus sp. 28 TaxID=161213 RepID=Q8VPN0_9MICC|nr:putative hydroxyproline-rich protein [Micrococcus sp. 28]